MRRLGLTPASVSRNVARLEAISCCAPVPAQYAAAHAHRGGGAFPAVGGGRARRHSKHDRRCVRRCWAGQRGAQGQRVAGLRRGPKVPLLRGIYATFSAVCFLAYWAGGMTGHGRLPALARVRAALHAAARGDQRRVHRVWHQDGPGSHPRQAGAARDDQPRASARSAPSVRPPTSAA